MFPPPHGGVRPASPEIPRITAHDGGRRQRRHHPRPRRRGVRDRCRRPHDQARRSPGGGSPVGAQTRSRRRVESRFECSRVSGGTQVAGRGEADADDRVAAASERLRQLHRPARRDDLPGGRRRVTRGHRPRCRRDVCPDCRDAAPLPGSPLPGDPLRARSRSTSTSAAVPRRSRARSPQPSPLRRGPHAAAGSRRPLRRSCCRAR